MKMSIGEKLRLLRISRGFNQENMADELGLSVGAYSNIERGKTDISLSRLFKISKILKTDIPTILEQSNYDSGKAKEPNAQYTTLAKHVEGLTEKIKEYEKVIEHQKNEIAYLKEIATLLKGSKTSKKK